MTEFRDRPDEMPGKRAGFLGDVESDTEGHLRRIPADDEIADDTEGHLRRVIQEDADTEGHVRRAPADDELDTEGHGRPYGVGEPEPTQLSDADDTEGHLRRTW
jgi:hypothetical protein